MAATWAVVGDRWPPAEGEPDLPFRREMRERGEVMAWLCEEHVREWTPSWGLGLRRWSATKT